jgi:hypothetical protein
MIKKSGMFFSDFDYLKLTNWSDCTLTLPNFYPSAIINSIPN